MSSADIDILDANDEAAKSRSQMIIEICFVLFMASVIIWPVISWSTPTDLSGGGNVLRQLSYISLLFVLVYSIGLNRSAKVISQIPLSVILVISWCLISLYWSIDPSVAIRRIILTIMIGLFIFLVCSAMSAERIIKLFRLVLIYVLVVNYIFVIFFPMQGIHQMDLIEDPGLAGAWKGFLPEKNLTGAVCAITVILVSFDAQFRSKLLRLAMFAMASYFLFKTSSKTSMGLCAISIVLGLAYRRYDKAFWPLAVTAFLGAIGAAAIYVSAHLEELLLPLQRPDALTGRAQIWPALASYVADHWVLGSGYGSFWNIGEDSPIFEYTRTGSWVQKISSGHNGYLDLAVQIGVPGLVLAVYAFVLRPLLSLATAPIKGPEGAALLALLVFSAAHNGTESTILDRDHFVNVCFILAVALVGTARTRMERGMEAPAKLKQI